MSAEPTAFAAANGHSAALLVDGLVAGYGEVTALDGVTVSAQAGGITAVLGANGAGKTTLLRTVDGSVKPASGRILLGGVIFE
ncbi:MAG: ATP-binding cassette domain-containing protein [Streptosporangiaceae bacterium]